MTQVADRSGVRRVNVAQNVALLHHRRRDVRRAVRVVTSNNVVHAALWLVVVLAGVAAQYILAAAEFVAVSQVLVYIGAVMVLFLFGIMLDPGPDRPRADLNNTNWALGIPVALLLLGLLSWAIIDAFGDDKLPDPAGPTPTAARSATACCRRISCRSWPLSFILLAAAIGAIVLARKD